jgi:iron complex outermembrane receptor protein
MRKIHSRERRTADWGETMKRACRFTSATAVATAVTFALSLQAFAQNAASTTQIDLPAQPLAQAIQAVARQAGINILVDPRLVAGRDAPAVKAEMSIQQALDLLLQGTGLTPRYVDDKTITLLAVPAPGTTKPAAQGFQPRATHLQLAQAAEQSSSEAAASTATPDKSTTLQEIIVTARKTSEAIQDVPISVTAFSGEQLQERGAVDVKDILRAVPGLSFTDVERGQTKYSIRGITSSVATPTTGVYLDDISLVTDANFFSLGAFDAIFFDVDHIEVLKGPQGTLYGGSAMGGAIKYVTARPDSSAFSASAGGGVSTIAHGGISNFAEAVVNVPLISDVLAIRAGVHYRHEGGFIDNVAGLPVVNGAESSTPYPVYTPVVQDSLSHATQEDYNSGDILVARLSALWEPDDTWSIRPAALYQESRQQNPSQFFTNAPALTASYRLLPQQQRDRTGIFNVDVEKRWGPVVINSVSAYFDRQVYFQRDYSYLFGRIFPPLFPYDEQAAYPFSNKTWSQELRLASSPERDSRFDYVLGLYYRDQKSADKLLVRIFEGESSPFGSPILLGGPGTGVDRTRTESAAFADTTWHVTDAFDVTAGVRVFNYDFTELDRGTPADNPAVLPNDEARLSGKEDGINPRVGASYQLNDDHMIYASAAKGFRPGGAQSLTAAVCDEELQRYGVTPGKFESDDLWAYELGSKNEFADGRMVLNAALFYNDWKDIQQGVRLTSCGADYTANLGAARVQGAELETHIRWTSMLEMGVNLTYTDAEITEIAPGTPSQKGDEILDTPEWMGSVYSSYLIPMNDTWDLKLRFDYTYRSKQRRSANRDFSVLFADGVRAPIPSPVLYQEGFDVLNAFATLNAGSTSIRLFVDNILDERPLLDARVDVGSSRGTTIRPRTIGLDVRKQF